jgi:hypothetical protein
VFINRIKKIKYPSFILFLILVLIIIWHVRLNTTHKQITSLKQQINNYEENINKIAWTSNFNHMIHNNNLIKQDIIEISNDYDFNKISRFKTNGYLLVLKKKEHDVLGNSIGKNEFYNILNYDIYSNINMDNPNESIDVYKLLNIDRNTSDIKNTIEINLNKKGFIIYYIIYDEYTYRIYKDRIIDKYLSEFTVSIPTKIVYEIHAQN